jgi:uncharacterized protein YdhG (YjbR/CyaY superfamily)
MKKMNSQSAPKSMDAYLRKVPEPARSCLQNIRAIIRSVVPSETTECISYGIPAFRYRGLLFGFAAFAKHCSLFPMSAGLIVRYKKELERFETAKGTIRFQTEKPPSAALIKKLVKARVAQNDAKKK